MNPSSENPAGFDMIDLSDLEDSKDWYSDSEFSRKYFELFITSNVNKQENLICACIQHSKELEISSTWEDIQGVFKGLFGSNINWQAVRENVHFRLVEFTMLDNMERGKVLEDIINRTARTSKNSIISKDS